MSDFHYFATATSAFWRKNAVLCLECRFTVLQYGKLFCILAKKADFLFYDDNRKSVFFIEFLDEFIIVYN